MPISHLEVRRANADDRLPIHRMLELYREVSFLSTPAVPTSNTPFLAACGKASSNVSSTLRENDARPFLQADAPSAGPVSRTLGRYMLIRRIQSHELNSLLDLYVHLHAEDDPRPEQEVLEAVWQEALTNPRCRYFGAYEGDRLISSCTLMVIPNLTRACRPYGVIENVVTHAAFRNNGHGKAVLAHALAFAWSERCYKVMLLTGRKDEATMRFYEGAGFDRNGKQAFIAKPAA